MEKVLNRILTELQALREGQTRMESRLDNLKHKTDRIDSGLLKLETRIENEVVEKIRALFDDRSVNQDYFASIKNSFARIDNQL